MMQCQRNLITDTNQNNRRVFDAKNVVVGVQAVDDVYAVDSPSNDACDVSTFADISADSSKTNEEDPSDLLKTNKSWSKLVKTNKTVQDQFPELSMGVWF